MHVNTESRAAYYHLMEISKTSADRQAPVCPKCTGPGKRVGAHENVAYFRCLTCTRIWARRLD
jgi:hypothetical protein